jgi:hypothetical protein
VSGFDRTAITAWSSAKITIQKEAISLIRQFNMDMLFNDGGSDLSLCAEDNWRVSPAGPLFQATQDRRVQELKELLQQNEWKRHVNHIDRDWAGILHITRWPNPLCKPGETSICSIP